MRAALGRLSGAGRRGLRSAGRRLPPAPPAAVPAVQASKQHRSGLEVVRPLNFSFASNETLRSERYLEAEPSTSLGVERPRSFADVIESHEALRTLVDLGVDLHSTLRMGQVPDLLYKLDSERDLKPRLAFLLRTVGLHISQLGDWLGRNPWFFTQDLDDLEARYNYLESKKFSRGEAAELIAAAPTWLNTPVKIVDDRLGYLQKEFGLTGPQVRSMAVAAPKLVLEGKGQVKMMRFALLEEMGFSLKEIRAMALRDPVLWTVGRELVNANFQFLQFTIGLSHRRIALEPQLLRAKPSLLRLRHEFLARLGRDQYDPERPSFVAVADLLRPDDADFALNVAKSTEQDYDNHLRND